MGTNVTCRKRTESGPQLTPPTCYYAIELNCVLFHESSLRSSIYCGIIYVMCTQSSGTHSHTT